MEILSLGEKIKKQRKKMNMTLKDLAKDRITPGQISLIESGRSNPSMDLLEYLSKTLNTTTEYFMESEQTQALKICNYYEKIAYSYIMSKNYVLSEKYIDEAFTYIEKYNLSKNEGEIVYLKAELYKLKMDYLKAEELYLSASIMFSKNKKYLKMIKALLNLAKVLVKVKSYFSAMTYLQEAEVIYNENSIESEYILGDIYYNISKIYYMTENDNESKKYAYLAKEKFGLYSNREKYARSLIKLSEKYKNEENIEEAINYSGKALEIYKSVYEQKYLAELQNDLGDRKSVV